MTREARAAAYALAEHLWRDHGPHSVWIRTSSERPRVDVHLYPNPSREAAEQLVRGLGGAVTQHDRGETAAWLKGTVIRDGQTVGILVFYQPDTTEEGPR